MGFELDKKNALEKIDKSKKGAIDKDIKKLVDKINSFSCYYTTSSCSGRILLISFPEDNKKYNVEWLFVSHDLVDFRTVKENLNKIILNFKNDNIKNDVWFREESTIMHVCCKTMEDASRLIEISKHIGFKRSGINAVHNRIILELVSTENMDTPVIKDGKLLVNDEYLKILVKEANKKLKRTKEKTKKLCNELHSLSSSR